MRPDPDPGGSPAGLARIAAGLICACAVAGAGRAQTPPVTSQEVAPRLHLIRGAVGNVVAFAGDDGILLFDTGVEERAAEVKEAVRSLSDKPVVLTVNSHWHYDHRGGNALLAAGAIRIAHPDTRSLLETPRVQFGEDYPALDEKALPNLLVGDELTLVLNGDRIRIFHLPNAHTRGDLLAYFERANVLATGDVFFKDHFPMIDLEAGGTLRGYIDAVEYLLRTMPEDVRIIPGHGTLANKDDLRRYRDMLVATSEQVIAGIRSGRSLAELLAAGLPEKWAAWAWGPGFITADRWIRIIYSSTTGQQLPLFED